MVYGMRRRNYVLYRVIGMISWLTVLNATSLPCWTSIVSMHVTLEVFLARFEGLVVSVKCFRGLDILLISRGILIFLAFYNGIGFVSTSNSWCLSSKMTAGSGA